MKMFENIRAAALTLAFAGVLSGPAGADGPRLVGAGTTAEQPFPFSLALELSDRARSTLGDRGEQIVVAAAYYGNPTPEGSEHANEVGQIGLGREEVQVPAEPGDVEITGSGIEADSLQWVEGELMVNVNVYSARLSSNDNLIRCDFIDGPLAVVSSKPVTLRCALIEENMETEWKP
ncbi:hypothetical protein NOF55_21750 [Rhizobiaceae bacterium BDR2-2]|uniref:Uncharacterized protein n=1 Tax=Ectorhizobium quercum TaxID=2965071 RepID=A0AAE3N4V8_9HYPH|nr:hypothetical protein [Ectorhizobium quercum]MCX8999734.1 hypothetical protein [Ectorhizobium quercum]